MTSPVQKSMMDTSFGSITSVKGISSGGGPGPGTKVFEDCTDKCRSTVDGAKIWNIGLGPDPTAVVCLWEKTCENYGGVRDYFGRTALHVAASTGNLKAVEWLLKTQPSCNINAKDFVSGYTALHRSIYFGQFHVALSLIKHGIDLNVRDNEGLTAFELCQLDRPKPFDRKSGDLTELTMWGSNQNYNLGLGHQEVRNFPDVMPEFRRSGMEVAKVEMNTYHTTFLTKAGSVYTCGSGSHGRLGIGNDAHALTPALVQLRNNGPCRDIAVGQDHTIFLTDTKVWTVGSNSHGQLAQPSIPGGGILKNPRTVDVLQKYATMNSVLAGTFHSVFYNNKEVFVCGQNNGQFGKGFENQAKVFHPTKLRLTIDTESRVTCVGGNDFCTAICVDHRHVFLMRRHQCVRIDSRNTTSQNILKIQASGDKDNVILFMLTASGRVLVWRENMVNPGETGAINSADPPKSGFTRLVFSSIRLLDVKDFSVSLSTVLVVTNSGDAYKAGWNYSNPPTIIDKLEEKFGQVAAADFQIAARPRRGRKEDETGGLALEMMKAKKVPNVFTALAVSSDLKGNNFAILQRHPKMDVTDIPLTRRSNIMDDIRDMYHETSIDDNISDVIFEIDSFNVFPAHRLILACQSPVFATLFEKHSDAVIKVTNKLFNIDPEKSASIEDPKNFQAILDIAYTRQCHYTSVEYLETCFNAAKDDAGNKNRKYLDMTKDISRFKALCRNMGMLDCEQLISRRMNSLEALVNGNPNRKNDIPRLLELDDILETPEVSFTPEAKAKFSDVVLVASDKTHFDVNKCILVARLEYFKSLFSVNWHDTTMCEDGTSKTKIALPFSSNAVSILLDWVYTNKADTLESADLDLISETLGCADYVMTDNLLAFCETFMSEKIHLKNVVEILIFASKHNASQLKKTCLDFISINMTAMLENHLMDQLPVELLCDLNDYYKNVQRDYLNVYRDYGGVPPSEEEYEAARMEAPEEMLKCLETIEESDGSSYVQKKYSARSGKSRVRLRSRNSESESTELKEQLAERKNDKADIFREDKIELMVNTNSQKATGTGLSFSSLHEDAHSANGNKVAPPRRLVVPLPKNAANKTEKPSIKSEEFPTLGSAPSSLKNSPPKITTRNNTSPKPNSAAAAPCPGSGKKKTKWRTISTGADVVPVDVSSGAIGSTSGSSSPSNITADGRDRNNPWRINSAPSTSASMESEVAFQAIVDDEVVRRRNFQRAISKPLRLMQMEDRAINSLTDFYTSDDTQDYIEIFTVERVGESNFSTPTWVQHPGAVNASFPAHQPATTSN